MNKAKFCRLINAAEYCDDDYRYGYRRGLRRHFHGPNFGEPDDHEKWMVLDGDRAEIGQGYRDGFAGKRPKQKNRMRW